MKDISQLELLKAETAEAPADRHFAADVWLGLGYASALREPVPIARAKALSALFDGSGKYIYPHDEIVGSIRGALVCFCPFSEGERKRYASLASSYGRLGFWNNVDHYAPYYDELLCLGLDGMLAMAKAKADEHADGKRRVYAEAMLLSLEAFQRYILGYADAAEAAGLPDAAAACRNSAHGPAKSFREALQLVWLLHVAFCLEQRYAMAIGRLDRLLLPYYERDLAAGAITAERATELLASAFIKIGERRLIDGNDDVVNIAIGGVDREGVGGVNAVSYCVLEAVRRCNIPGPNLSARLYNGVPDEFLDACLRVIGTGLGYPALMNDEVNIQALARHGYSLADARDYAMVGCIENFIAGKQPPWSDGRYNSPKYIELALNGGRDMRTGVPMGPETPMCFESMCEFVAAVRQQMEYGADEYVARFANENSRYDRFFYAQPFLSCFCFDCLGRSLDVNDGGALYPSVHGACGMGIATFADSLAAVERSVFTDKRFTFAELRQLLLDNFEGREADRAYLLSLPKYGNNDETADKYARLFVRLHDEIFSRYKTPDGGDYYIAIASNVQNIPAGKEIAATPDGRAAGEPLSDAASPMHGMDKNGPTAVVLSTTKPDFTRVACGTVLNQKFSPSMFSDEGKRAKLLKLIKCYFAAGGQEMQINSVSREILTDAMEHPENYGSLVVRVSGFSAYYTALDRSVQQDILKRTEHE